MADSWMPTPEAVNTLDDRHISGSLLLLKNHIPTSFELISVLNGRISVLCRKWKLNSDSWGVLSSQIRKCCSRKDKYWPNRKPHTFNRKDYVGNEPFHLGLSVPYTSWTIDTLLSSLPKSIFITCLLLVVFWQWILCRVFLCTFLVFPVFTFPLSTQISGNLNHN